jgi:mannose-6-phosphate isomerase-like protein (cupin superfamily)
LPFGVRTFLEGVSHLRDCVAYGIYVRRIDARSQPPEFNAGALAGNVFWRSSDDFAAVEWSDPGGGEREWIAPLHVHHLDDEAWYVLEGRLRFRLGEDELEAGPSEYVIARKGTPHAYGNALKKPVRYLLISTPRILELVEELHAPAGDALDYRAIFRKYDSEMLGG